MALERLRDALHLHLHQVHLDTSSAQYRARRLEHQHLHHVDRREPAAYYDRAVARLEHRAGIAGLLRVVEPDDERILVDQTAALVGVGALDRQRPIAPGAAREHHAREAPLIGELAEGDVAADLGVRHERHVRTRELAPDRLVFLVAQRDVPARQTVFDLAVRAAVLFEHRHFDPALGERAGYFGARDGSTDHGDAMRRFGRIHRGCIVTAPLSIAGPGKSLAVTPPQESLRGAGCDR